MIKNFLKSLGYAVLMVVFPVVASVIIQVGNITNDTLGYIIQGIFFLVASVIGIVLLKRQDSCNEKGKHINKRGLLWFIPIIGVEVIVFISGIDMSHTILYYVVLLFFTLFVGISEEVFFRGLILSKLKSENMNSAIMISSALFAVLHLTNLAGGVSIEYAILQLLFAFIFGIVTAQLTVITKSLVPAIIWHFSHDFISFLTGNELNAVTLVILVIQCVVLVIYSIYLHRVIKKL
ncbi:CPBP family intramembrane metalloprotease [Listeria monocytogenes]|uniref:CPBP family intramembrane glutamic endopeptidase n=1 Tax=Listeria monocytogenes TaxID=1639 RepID=UPI000E717DBE|nr:CPBP family intramembrane glutamic endopeptidase [Listeria monocytogenes]EAF4531493.1 CPBP family intramembrane metalloprotease [Listeria monocytogenes serotype 1/2a]EAE8309419.1 CPBP family intramembrane metalloprotease [Listeria monocytogenes]EAF2801650.1 CPBP family intramembrane metalloprotease [Listeria monocytogenes]EHD1395338.1 CPBP family intramembrane metalloprotease [Listeria monocytogenes]EHD1581877.1 CPBP family intramembrane metalloprotease [Listeria monocytogenes]